MDLPAIVLDQRKSTAAVSIRREQIGCIRSLTDLGFHPAILQLPALLVELGRALLKGYSGKFFRAEPFYLFRHHFSVFVDHIFPVFLSHLTGLQLEYDRHILKFRLERRSHPGFRRFRLDCARDAIGERAVIIEVNIVLTPCRGAYQRILDLTGLAVDGAEYLRIAVLSRLIEIFPRHIDILIAFRIVFRKLHVAEINQIGIMRSIQFFVDNSVFIPHRSGASRIRPFHETPQLKFSTRPDRPFRIQPGFMRLIRGQPFQRQINRAAAVDAGLIAAVVWHRSIVIFHLQDIVFLHGYGRHVS